MDETILRLRNYMNLNNLSMQDVATGASISKGAICQWLQKTYTGNNENVTLKIQNYLDREQQRVQKWVLPETDISTMQYVTEIARLCHTHNRIGVCVGVAGLGKTYAAKAYAKKFIDTILVESNYNFTAKALLTDIHKNTGLSCKGSSYEMMEEIIDKLSGSNRLLIIDEAENLRREALEIARRIHDKTDIGILLIGREILLTNLRGKKNQYDQLYSRVVYNKKLGDLTITDITKVLTSAGQGTKLANKYLFHSHGNTRRLEHLLCSSIGLAKLNGKTEVDDAVLERTSKKLMDKEEYDS